MNSPAKRMASLHSMALETARNPSSSTESSPPQLPIVHLHCEVAMLSSLVISTEKRLVNKNSAKVNCNYMCMHHNTMLQQDTPTTHDKYQHNARHKSKAQKAHLSEQHLRSGACVRHRNRVVVYSLRSTCTNVSQVNAPPLHSKFTDLC